MLETGIGRAHNVALASLPNFQLPGDISASKRYYEQDLVWPPFEITPEGMMAVPQGLGIGVEVEEERLEEVTVRRLEFSKE
jgi:O-succinylbenzoate synthase